MAAAETRLSRLLNSDDALHHVFVLVKVALKNKACQNKYSSFQRPVFEWILLKAFGHNNYDVDEVKSEGSLDMDKFVHTLERQGYTLLDLANHFHEFTKRTDYEALADVLTRTISGFSPMGYPGSAPTPVVVRPVPVVIVPRPPDMSNRLLRLLDDQDPLFAITSMIYSALQNKPVVWEWRLRAPLVYRLILINRFGSYGYDETDYWTHSGSLDFEKFVRALDTNHVDLRDMSTFLHMYCDPTVSRTFDSVAFGNARPAPVVVREPPTTIGYPQPYPNEPTEEDDTKACTICFTRGITTTCVPCGHCYSCVTCILQAKPTQCAICREALQCVVRKREVNQ
jgi:hypothetical protein